MLNFFFGTALILFGLPNGSIFTDGFEGLTDVYISTDRPENIVWSLISSPTGDAAVVTSLNYLSDGKIAIPTRITTDTGSISTSDAFNFKATVPGTVTPGKFVIAVFFPKTPFAVPAGVEIDAFSQHGLVTTALATGTTVQLNNGATAAIFFVSALINGGSPLAYDYLLISVLNNLNGSTWYTAGQTVDTGEIWFGSLNQFNLVTDPKFALIDPTLQRRSHNNNPWPLFIKPYKQWTFNFTPMSNTKAYNSASVPSFDSVRYSLAAGNCALVLPRIYTPGTTTINTVDLNQLACFGKPDQVGQISAVKEGPLWTATMLFGEAPP